MAKMIFKETSALCRKEYGKSIEEAIECWRRDGFSQSYIAGMLGVSPLTVRRWAQKFGIVFDRSKYNRMCFGGTSGKTWTRRAEVMAGVRG